VKNGKAGDSFLYFTITKASHRDEGIGWSIVVFRRAPFQRVWRPDLKIQGDALSLPIFLRALYSEAFS
jgi:hypothetical protein